MIIPANPSSAPEAWFRNGLHSGAGALTSHRRKRDGKGAVESTAAVEAWTNEGGSIAPAADNRGSDGQEHALEKGRLPNSGKCP